jgi:nicotinate-nucleotide adenylyltransferase
MKSTSRTVRLLFGGTFDPVHRAHIQIALDAAMNVDADFVHLIPCFIPVHRDLPNASEHQRLAMLELATKNQPRISIDKRELERAGPSYTIDTLKSFRLQYPNDCIIFLMGTDSWNCFHQWYRWKEFTDYCHLVIAKRPNYSINIHQDVLNWCDNKITTLSDEIINNSCGKILQSEMSLLPISATKVRDSILKNESIQHLITPEVASYIKQNALYQRGNL